MINSQDIKKGTCIRLDGKLYFCVDFLHVKPGKGNTIMRTTCLLYTSPSPRD
mgnify:CR=1